MNEEQPTQGHKFEPLSYIGIGACIDVQRQIGLHCMEVDYQRALKIATKTTITSSSFIEIQEGLT